MLKLFSKKNSFGLGIRDTFKLQSSADSYEGFYNQAPLGFYQFSTAGKILNANAKFMQMHKLESIADIEKLNRTGDTLMCDYSWEEFENLFSGEKEVNIEAMRVRKDGSFFYAQESYAVVRNKFGRAKAYYGVVKDISGQKKFEASLIQSKNSLMQLIQYLPNPIFIKDNLGRYIMLNLPMAKLLSQIKTDDVIGKTDAEFYSNEEALEIYTSERKVIESGKVIVNFEQEFIVENNTSRHISFTKVPLKGEGSKISAILCVGYDITSGKIESVEMEKAVKKAQEADKLKTAFLANMSHEIRTPLNAILGFAELLGRRDIEEQKIQMYLDIIINNGNSLLRLVNDLIDISKIASQQLKIVKTSFSLNKLMLFLENNTNLLINSQQKNIQFIVTNGFKDGEDIIYTDKFRLEQILLNLLNNAVKFTHEGIVKFSYQCKDDMIQFDVSDTGIGISKNVGNAVFERFRQVELHSKRQFGGAGLGLSISKSLAEYLGGDLFYDSEEEVGSVFSLSIPFIKESSHSEKEAQKNSPAIK